MAASRKRGFTLIEAIMATSVMSIAIIGMFTSWIGIDLRYGRSREVALAGQLARAAMEEAKVYGMANMPIGTYSGTTKTGTWSGTYDPTANSGAGGWVSGASSYYDQNGTLLAGSGSTGVILQVQVSTTDSNVVPNSALTSYGFQMLSEKAVVVTVTRTGDNTVLFTGATNQVLGGI